MNEVCRILKPGTGWAQCIEFGYPYCLSKNDSLPKDAPLSKVERRHQNNFKPTSCLNMFRITLELAWEFSWMLPN